MNSPTEANSNSKVSEVQGAPPAGDQSFQLLVNAIKDYAIYMLDPAGRVTNWNAGAQLIKGYAEEEIVGQHFSCFYTPEDQRAGEPERALQTALAEKKYEKEAWRVRKDGTRFYASVVIQPLYDGAGRHIGFAKITRDITERKKMHEEMERARDALNNAQKLEALGRLTGGVAHDFNNFLAIIRTAAELIRKSGDDPARRERYGRAISDTAGRAALLTKQLLAFARQQPLRPEVFQLRQKLMQIEPLIETMLGPHIELQVELAESLEAVIADVNQFDTALMNLVINAKDAMPQGGRLKISARNVEAVPAVRQHAAVDGAFVAISIDDSGRGIEPPTLARIFDPFFTTKPAHQGTGLGLSQVYGFAKQSHGEVDVRSQVGDGTCFTLYLPRSDAAAMPLEARLGGAASSAEDSMAARRSVLLVEDDDDVGQFASTLLSEVGHTVIRAANALEALDLLRAQPERFDLVFTDVIMPGMNGVELAREIRSRWPGLPVALTSGYSRELASQGHHDFELLHKPYSVQELESFLSRIPQRERQEPGSGS